MITARASRRVVVAVVVVAALIILVSGVAVVLATSGGTAARGAPGPGVQIVATELSAAADAADDAAPGTAEGTAAAFLSDQGTAYWLTPERDPGAAAAERVEHIAREAREQSAQPVFVVYGLPGRDCGRHSAGGLAEPEYVAWVDTIGDALERAQDVSPIVVLEPDSLALAPECGNVRERTRQLSAAIGSLSAPDIHIYVDGGHSNWLSAAEMANLIDPLLAVPGDSAGRAVRGFATNTSNFNRTAEEVAYAHALAALLGGLHAVIDTSRNGAGTQGDWCNPPDRKVGEPAGTIGDDVVDTNLWIKPPGESDGPCNGGPPAGEWWPEAAVELTRDAVDR